MQPVRMLAVLLVAALVASCGGDDVGSADHSPAVSDGVELPPVETQPAPTRVPPAPNEVVVPVAGPVAVESDSVFTRAQDLEQPWIWPAADVVFATPEEAAADFVRGVLISEGEPLLGEFLQGDSRSGEIDVLFAGEVEGADPSVKGALALRQLGSDDGWFVLGAGSDGATITSPEALIEVPAGPLTVEGDARGFEGTVVVSAFPAGDVGAQLDMEIARGGAFAELEPYSAVLDLSNAVPGEVVAILVHGDTGLGSDPSTFAAIPVVIEDTIPPTR